MRPTGPLARLARLQALGRDVVPPRIPPHLCGRRWRHLCDCGLTWTSGPADAVLEDNRIAAPRVQCTSCHQWVRGRLVD